MPPALKQLLTETDALIAKAKGAVAVAAKDIQKEVLYLAGKLDIANSADNRELVYKAVEKRIATLGSKLNTLSSTRTTTPLSRPTSRRPRQRVCRSKSANATPTKSLTPCKRRAARTLPP